MPSQVAELAPMLGWGVGGSGWVCGVFLAALLAKALQGGAASDQAGAGLSRPAPSHEWLDAVTPGSPGIGNAEPCSTLAGRLTGFATEQYGGVECWRISGVEWPAHSPGFWGQYYSGGGAERCSRFIAEARFNSNKVAGGQLVDVNRQQLDVLRKIEQKVAAPGGNDEVVAF